MVDACSEEVPERPASCWHWRRREGRVCFLQMPDIIIRVKTKDGTERLKVDADSPFGGLRELIAAQLGIPMEQQASPLAPGAPAPHVLPNRERAPIGRLALGANRPRGQEGRALQPG